MEAVKDIRGRDPTTGLVHAFCFAKDRNQGHWFAWCRHHLVVQWIRWKRVDSATVTCVYCAAALPP